MAQKNVSRLKVEGLDKPLARPKYHDRIKIDPFTKRYHTRSRRRASKRA